MSRVAAGDEEALAAVFQRLAPAVRSVGRRIAGPAAADDVAQDTFERLWRHADVECSGSYRPLSFPRKQHSSS